MKILMTGGTGFIGKALTMRLLADGHQVSVLTRDVDHARSVLGDDVTPVPIDQDMTPAVAEADAVINLAGEPVVGRWSEEKKARLRKSRVDTTRRLVEAMKTADRKPEVLVSGSAVGYYGDTSDALVTESSPAGQDLLAELCRDWEGAAMEAKELGVRVAIIRTGVVLGRGGGALEKMLPAFKAGAGGRIASGSQYMAWIHLHDLVELFVTAVEDERYRGPFNGTAPEPVTNRQFTDALGRVLHRPTLLPVPAFALKALLGEGATPLTASQRAIPTRAKELGFSFRFTDVEAALSEILSDERRLEIRRLSERRPLPNGRRPRWVLEQHTTVDAPVDQVFRFFSSTGNLGAMTPPALDFEIVERPESLGPGAHIDYRLKVAGVPLKWRTSIEEFDPDAGFVDDQESGPYRCWWHEHRFEAKGEKTEMVDRVRYDIPLGPIGSLVHELFVKPMLSRIFAYRADVTKLRFRTPALGPS